MINNKFWLFLGSLLIAVFYLLAFYPGYMSFDSGHHYKQLQSGEWTTFQPVIILWFWSFTDRIIAGPGGLFLLFLSIYILALGMIAYHMQGAVWTRILVLLTALLPVNIMIFPHIWKDIGLLVLVLFSVAWLLVYERRQHRLWLWFSIFSLWLGILFRFEAVLYLLPLLWLQMNKLSSSAEPNRYGKKHLWRIVSMVGIFCMLSLLGQKSLSHLSAAKQITLWPTIALWDIARVSVYEQEILLPTSIIDPKVTVEDIAKSSHNWTNTTLYANIYLPLSADELQHRQLLKLWLSLPFTYPESYFLHRWRLWNELLRFEEATDKPQELFWVNQMVGFEQQFKINQTALNQIINQQLTKHKDSFYFKPWFFLLLGLLILVWIWSCGEPDNQQHRLAKQMIYCCLLLPCLLFFIAPAAEQRYLIVLFNFIPIACCLSFYRN